MKNLIIVLTLILTLFLSACSSKKNIDGVTYDTYGLFNSEEKKNSSIQYEVSVGNFVWGCLLVSTVVAPIYFFGFDLYQPIGKKNPVAVKGQVN